jgi:hypothetical protein
MSGVKSEPPVAGLVVQADNASPMVATMIARAR